MKPLVIVDFPTHYTIPTLLDLKSRTSAEVVCLSSGDRDYWQPHLSASADDLDARALRGRTIVGRLNVNIPLAQALWQRDYDLILMELSGRTELLTAFAASRIKSRPFILWTGMWTHPSTPFHRATWPATRFLYRHADALLVYGHHVKRFLVTHGVRPDRIFVAEHAVDNALYEKRVDCDRVAAFRTRVGASQRPLVLCVARLVSQKGIEHLIAAAAQLADLRPIVAVVGTGPLAARLQAQAAAEGVALELIGPMAPHEMPIAYSAADVFVMPSISTPQIKECWGLAINEAMCQSLPVIATDAVGAVAGGLVVDGVTGIVVPERDPDRLAAALRGLLVDKEERSRLGAAGHERIGRTTQSAMVDAFEEAFVVTLDRRRPRRSRGRRRT